MFVIDNDTLILRMIMELLENKGFEIITTDNGKTVIDLADNNSPNLVLLDIMMADIDGYSIRQRIREFSDFR